jgi:hypothetical protein
MARALAVCAVLALALFATTVDAKSKTTWVKVRLAQEVDESVYYPYIEPVLCCAGRLGGHKSPRAARRASRPNGRIV